ncbi:MAG: RNA pseudouridine synthase [Opitutaceae bacterium]|nr:RNA pseudouridine synthase [Opitutaceae bacterium]
MSPWPVVFEDEALLVLDKPAGLAVVAEPGAAPGETLLESVRARHGAAVTNVHRPEAGASGLGVFAKDKPAQDFLSGQFQAKTVRQVWHALVIVRADGAGAEFWPRDGARRVPDAFAMDWWIGQEVARPGVMQAFRRHGGQPARTAFTVEENFGAHALLRCEPESNRRHQLRVHLAAVGLPVLNDALYGLPDAPLLLSALKRGYKGGAAERPLIRQLALHASGLTLAHPRTRAAVALAASLPEQFAIALKNLRKFARPARR